MVRVSTLEIAKELIKDKIDKYNLSILSRKDISELLHENRSAWKLPKYVNLTKFIEFLLKAKIIKEFSFISNNNSKKSVYTKNKAPDILSIAAKLKKNAYYSFYSAMYLHQLTLQIPKTHYLNYERYSLVGRSELNQSLIDQAFSKEKKRTSLSYQSSGNKFYFVNGAHTQFLGVIKNQERQLEYYYTDLERTLIDIVVRPYYSGGVVEVLDAFSLAKDKFDPVKLRYYLDQLDYIYPYHQSIGFYLERIGVEESVLDLFKENIMFDFYLTYNIRNKEYSKKWKVFYPKGL